MGPHNPRTLDAGALPLDERAVVVGRVLGELALRCDPLLAVTPVDIGAARAKFLAGGARHEPRFHYRPLTEDPGAVRRDLDDVALDDVDDPAVAMVCVAKAQELSAQLDLVEERGSTAFLSTSARLYGVAEPDLVDLAHRVLAAAARAPGDPARDAEGSPVGAEQFARAAADEVERLARQLPGLDVAIEIRDDISGLMVDHGRLLIGSGLAVTEARVAALVQHEVGTHVLTWVNGRHQPLDLLRVGTAGYDETQEALGVIAEYLVGGLTASRLTTIALRVVAVDSLVGGASFVETFRTVQEAGGLTEGGAFAVTARVHCSGGFTKDVVYLRGLRQLLSHLRDGGAIEPLLLGKYSITLLPLIDDLRARRVLGPAVLRPSWLDWPGGSGRREALCAGMDADQLLRGGDP